MKVTLLLGVIYVTVVTAAPQEPGAPSTQKVRNPSECMAKKSKVKPQDCCTGLDLIPSAELAECEAEYPSNNQDGPERHGPRFCVMDCYFNKTGIFSDGQPVKPVALDILGRSTDEDFTALLNEGIEKCIQVAKDHHAKMQEKMSSRPNRPRGPPPDDSGRARCRPDARFFYSCIQLFMYTNCPSDKLVASDQCSQFKEFTEKCIPPMF